MFELTATSVETAVGVLAAAREAKAAENTAAARVLAAAADWADLHPAESIHDAAVLAGYGENAVPVAGPGAPLVAEFCIAEFAAVLRLPTGSGRELVGEALELRHRLPRCWARVMQGSLVAWRARRIARETMTLCVEAAAYVDSQVSGFAHRVGQAEVGRLIADATARFMPEAAEAARQAGADQRHVSIGTESVSFFGTTWIAGELDYADASDLDIALSAGAASLAAAGSAESLDARRAIALGELARRQTALDLASCAADGSDRAEGSAGFTPGRTAKPRQVVLHVHLCSAALGDLGGAFHPARLEFRGRHLVTTDQVRAWCGNPDTIVTVKPIVDLNQRTHVAQYEVPGRLAEQIRQRDLTCVFPWCTRPSAGCDLDHVIPYQRGGPTASDNLAALCRHHHRLKTHAGWTYTILEPGCYLWRSPHGQAFLRDNSGTSDLGGDPPDR